MNATDPASALLKIQKQAAAGLIRITQHAHQEMAEEGISLDEVLEAVSTAEMVENYPEHRRGACCLINGRTRAGRFLHVVCTTAQPVLIIITVYEPKAPHWVTPTKRGT